MQWLAGKQRSPEPGKSPNLKIVVRLPDLNAQRSKPRVTLRAGWRKNTVWTNRRPKLPPLASG